MFSAASDWLVMEFYWICNCCFVSFYNILIIWDLFFNQRHRGLGRKSLNTINRSQSYDLLITIHDALQLSYRRLLGAKATKGHFNTSSPRHTRLISEGGFYQIFQLYLDIILIVHFSHWVWILTLPVFSSDILSGANLTIPL